MESKFLPKLYVNPDNFHHIDINGALVVVLKEQPRFTTEFLSVEEHNEELAKLWDKISCMVYRTTNISEFRRICRQNAARTRLGIATF